jgi:hypothetical protein
MILSRPFHGAIDGYICVLLMIGTNTFDHTAVNYAKNLYPSEIIAREAARRLVGNPTDYRCSHCVDYCDDRSLIVLVLRPHLATLDCHKNEMAKALLTLPSENQDLVLRYQENKLAKALLLRQIHYYYHCVIALDGGLVRPQDKDAGIVEGLSNGWIHQG